jgi:hypothetical protein
VDCGGSCKVRCTQPTSSASCRDHTQNGDETGVDCGGSCNVRCTQSTTSTTMPTGSAPANSQGGNPGSPGNNQATISKTQQNQRNSTYGIGNSTYEIGNTTASLQTSGHTTTALPVCPLEELMGSLETIVHVRTELAALGLNATVSCNLVRHLVQLYNCPESCCTAGGYCPAECMLLTPCCNSPTSGPSVVHVRAESVAVPDPENMPVWQNCTRAMSLFALLNRPIYLRPRCGDAMNCEFVALMKKVSDSPQAFNTSAEYVSCVAVMQAIHSAPCVNVTTYALGNSTYDIGNTTYGFGNTTWHGIGNGTAHN